MKPLALACPLVLALILGVALPASAISFHYQFKFETGPFQPDGGSAGEGTATGISLRTGGGLVLTDALDDQLYETDLAGNFVRSLPMDPFCSTVTPACVPGSKSAQFASDVAVDLSTGNLYVIDDRPSSDPTVLNLIDGDGVHIADWDVTGSVPLPGALAMDPRNGDLLATDVGSDSVIRFDASDFTNPALTTSYGVSAAGAPAGLAAFDSLGTFLVLDSVLGKVFEYHLPAGAGSATFLGESVLTGFDLSTAQLLGATFDQANQRLYLTDDNAGSRVLVYAVAPEPAAALLVGLGLVALLLFVRPRRRRHH